MKPEIQQREEKLNYVASSLFDIITLIITDKLDSAKKGKLEGN